MFVFGSSDTAQALEQQLAATLMPPYVDRPVV